MSIMILLADDHQLFREGMCAMLEKEPDMDVVGQVHNGRSAVAQAHKLKPDVVVMDISMPDLNGIDATRQIMKRTVEAKVLALPMHSDRRFVEGMLKAGAHGFLMKDCANEELVRAIREVADVPEPYYCRACGGSFRARGPNRAGFADGCSEQSRTRGTATHRGGIDDQRNR